MTDAAMALIGSGVLTAALVAAVLWLTSSRRRTPAGWHRWRRRLDAAARHFVQRRRDIRALRRQRGVPIEQVAADLRRLRGLLGRDQNRSAAQQLGTRLAYDRLLVQACAMLDIEHELGDQSSGLERDIERFRVEAELERAGVVFSDPGWNQAA